MIDLHIEVIDVQLLFETNNSPQTYVEESGKYPDAPSRCPHCHNPVKLSKHGFYTRYIILLLFAGNIRIRRYICLKCGLTVSMLPSFCIPRYQYGAEVIITALLTAAMNSSTRYAVTRWSERPQTLTRRHIIHYRQRVVQNRGRIQLGLNLMSPGFIEMKQITGDTDWTSKFLEAATEIKPPQFNSRYHRLTGKSFMSLHNNVA